MKSLKSHHKLCGDTQKWIQRLLEPIDLITTLSNYQPKSNNKIRQLQPHLPFWRLESTTNVLIACKKIEGVTRNSSCLPVCQHKQKRWRNMSHASTSQAMFLAHSSPFQARSQVADNCWETRKLWRSMVFQRTRWLHQLDGACHQVLSLLCHPIL